MTTIRTDKKRAIALKMGLITRQIQTRFDHRAETFGLSTARWTLIVAVARNPGATQRAIAAVLGTTEVNAGRLIDRLCADGYLVRREPPGNRRSYGIYLTEAAKPLLKQLAKLASDLEEEAFAGLSEERLTLLESLLQEVAENIVAPRSLAELGIASKINLHGRQSNSPQTGEPSSRPSRKKTRSPLSATGVK